MKKSQYTSKNRWDEAVEKLSEIYQVYAPVETWGHLDYKLIGTKDVAGIIYNRARPTTPLKSFLLPLKENVSKPASATKKIIIGVPNCDLKGLEILDCMYLSNDFVDPAYELNRKNTIIISTDCHEVKTYCHCTTYGLNPFPEYGADVELSIIGENALLNVTSEKGTQLMEEISGMLRLMGSREDLVKKQKEKRTLTTDTLNKTNHTLPDYKTSAQLIAESDDKIWKQYSQNCVSCGACSTSCPTCTCFLLIDRPGFEKIRSVDTCQFPGFERVAAGENPLEKISKRLKNRYLCKFVWKPEKFNVLACTGCGRCIEGCIGNINKNELLFELASAVKTF